MNIGIVDLDGIIEGRCPTIEIDPYAIILIELD